MHMKKIKNTNTYTNYTGETDRKGDIQNKNKIKNSNHYGRSINP